MKKVKKGYRGYISYRKRICVLRTIGLFILPLGLFFIGVASSGRRLNLFSVIAALGCLPACQSAVGMIMILLQKKMPDDRYEAVQETVGDLVTAYELVITAYEHTSPVEAAVVCGSQVVCFTPDEKTDPPYLEKHISEILVNNGIRNEQVKVMKDFRQFLQRVTYLRENSERYNENLEFTPDTRYPDLTHDEVIFHLLLAISL